MEEKDKAFGTNVSPDRPGSSEGIGMPTQGSTKPDSGSGFGAQSPSSSAGTGDLASGFGVTEGSDLGGSSGRSAGGLSTGDSLGSDIESHECSHCGSQHVKGSETQGFDKILNAVGINDQAIQKMRESLENLDLDSYFTQAKEYLGESATKAKSYAKDHKSIIGTALAVVAVGAGVLIAVNRKSGDRWLTPRIDDRDINRV